MKTPNSAVGLIDDIDYSGQGGIATTFDVDQIEIHEGTQVQELDQMLWQGLFI